MPGTLKNREQLPSKVNYYEAGMLNTVKHEKSSYTCIRLLFEAKIA